MESISGVSRTEPNNLYPPPSAIPWWVLFNALAALNLGARIVLRASVAAMILALAYKTWAIYLCMWIRSVNLRATSIFWVIGSFLLDCILVFLSIFPERTPLTGAAILSCAVLGIGSGITAIYVVRHELMEHYNKVEPRGLNLGPVLTFFFSYLYFQYHLHDIAGDKRRELESIAI